MELRICHLYPDVLDLYGDSGNIICLKKRLEWRGIDVCVTPLPLGKKADLTEFDLFLIGSGQGFEREALYQDLASGKSEEIRAAIDDGKVFLAVGHGYQLLGQYHETARGEKRELIGALDFYSKDGDSRVTGDCLLRLSPEDGGGTIVGFENHLGRVYHGSGVRPLGQVISGFGNNGEDRSEGVRWKNVFGTFCHGPLLPKNPQLADHILELALGLRYSSGALAPLDDRLEQTAHKYMENRLLQEK